MIAESKGGNARHHGRLQFVLGFMLGLAGIITFQLSTSTTNENQRLASTISFKSTSEVDVAAATRKIVLVHVGKAGGNTVRTALPLVKCYRELVPEQKAECYQKAFARYNSPLALQSYIEIHLGHVGPESPMGLQNYTTYLYAIRNPITRAISAFNFLHHNNTKSQLAQKQNSLKDVFYKECFPSLQHFLEALDQASTISATERSSCQRMVITALKGNEPKIEQFNIHLRDNYQFYFDWTLGVFPEKEVFAVRTESLWDDIKALDRTMGGAGNFTAEGHVENKNTKTSSAVRDNLLSSRHTKNMCCVLWKENDVYLSILNRAVNLPISEKLESIKELWDMCGIVPKETASAYRIDPTTGSIQFSWYEWYQHSCPDLGEF